MCPAPHFAYMWQISRDGNSHFAYTRQIPRDGNSHFAYTRQIPRDGNSHFAYTRQIPRDGNSHFAYIWQVITGKSHFGGTFSTVKGYISADYLPQISEMTFSRRPNPPLIRQMTLFTASRSAAHWNVSSQNTPRRSAAHRRNP